MRLLIISGCSYSDVCIQVASTSDTIVKNRTAIRIGSKDFPEAAEMLKSLAHPDRLAIMELLNNCDCERMTVKHIYEQLKLDQPVASRHLGIMKRSGLVKRETEGSKTFFSLNQENAITVCLSKCLKSNHD